MSSSHPCLAAPPSAIPPPRGAPVCCRTAPYVAPPRPVLLQSCDLASGSIMSESERFRCAIRCRCLLSDRPQHATGDHTDPCALAVPVSPCRPRAPAVPFPPSPSPELLLSRRPAVPVQLFNSPRTLSNPCPSSNLPSTVHAVIAGRLGPFVLGPGARRGDKEKEKERADVSMFVSIDGDWFLPPSTLEIGGASPLSAIGRVYFLLLLDTKKQRDEIVGIRKMRDGLEVTLRLRIEHKSLNKCHRVAKGCQLNKA